MTDLIDRCVEAAMTTGDPPYQGPSAAVWREGFLIMLEEINKAGYGLIPPETMQTLRKLFIKETQS